jgi:hypothetical protein
MLRNLKGELIKKGQEPLTAIMSAIKCSEKTARNKLNGDTSFTVPEAVKVINSYFSDDGFKTDWLFENFIDPKPFNSQAGETA